ncbi:molecular chaperone [Bifidobacterium breve]|nr:molecular chaperone [Bifidobacterium breve]KFI50632.1 molecular chaperone [Bifidobacterium breve]
MTRIDRKTGEPILSPKLTDDQLYAMANEPGWRPWMRLIAEHPHAWPELADWWHTAQEQGFDTAGAAPLPPASMRGRRRVAIPSAPLPPEDEPGQEPVSAPAEKALKDADDDFAALERIADLESDTADIPPIPEAESSGLTVTYSADPDDLKVRRVFPVGKALVAIVMAASLIAVSWMGLQIKTRHAAAVRQEAHETAISACDSAEATRKTIQSDLDRTTAKASRLLKDTSRGQVADPKTLDALNRLLDAKTSTIKGSCAPDAVTSDVDRTTAALRRTTKELKNRLTDLKTAAKAVTDSKLDKTVDDANALYKQTDGKVADDKTRASLLDAIKKRDADAIAKAVKEVNESKMDEGKGRRGGESQGRTGSRCGRRAAGAGIAIPIGSTAANTLIFGRKPIPIPRKFRIRFRNRSTSVFGRLVVLHQYGRSLAGMVRARAIRRGHRLARQRSGALIRER